MRHLAAFTVYIWKINNANFDIIFIIDTNYGDSICLGHHPIHTELKRPVDALKNSKGAFRFDVSQADRDSPVLPPIPVNLDNSVIAKRPVFSEIPIKSENPVIPVVSECANIPAVSINLDGPDILQKILQKLQRLKCHRS